MNIRKALLVILCSIPLVVSSCGGASGPGPRAWIDAPLDGSNLPLAPVTVRSHASSGSGTTSAALYVNGKQVRVDNVTDPSAQLVEISQVWEPALPGSYEIKVVTLDSSGNQGNSNSVHVNVGEVVNPAPAEGGQPPETVEPASIETKTPTPTPASEPPPSIPAFTFTMNANCREGPSTQYEVDDSFLQGQRAQIDGRSQYSPLWWWVQRSNGGHCWVSDSTGTASGPTGNVQVVAAPPPPAVVVPPTVTSAAPQPPPPAPPQSPPSAPYKLHVQKHVCAGSTYTVTLAWNDKSDNETGFRVYRDGALLTTLGANVTSYTDSPPTGGPYYYMVEAFNNAGATQSNSAKDDGCIF